MPGSNGCGIQAAGSSRFGGSFGYASDLNVVITGSGRDGSPLTAELKPDTVAPPSVVEFFNTIEELSLPDAWNG